MHSVGATSLFMQGILFLSKGPGDEDIIVVNVITMLQIFFFQ